MNQWILLGWVVTLVVTCVGHPRVRIEEPNSEALHRLLKVFGLDHRVVSTKKRPLPPQYMVDLYRSVAAGGFIDKSKSGVNTVRSFRNKSPRSDEGNRFFFDISSIPPEEDIMEAEFHLYTSHVHDRQLPLSHVLQIQLYEGPANESGKLLEARLVSGHASAWEVFRIAPTIRRWNQHYNRGLSVRVLDYLGRDVSNRRLQPQQEARKPILVVFSRDLKYTAATPSHELPKYLPPTDSELNNTIDTGGMRNTRSAMTSAETGGCTRHELRVDFERIGWSTWILSPKWYEAYVCAGACSFPLGQNQRPTNHATVQSIVHELGLYPGMSTPSCVPTELRPVNLLYLDEHMNVVLKQYDDMVAAGCGCH